MEVLTCLSPELFPPLTHRIASHSSHAGVVGWWLWCFSTGFHLTTCSPFPYITSVTSLKVPQITYNLRFNTLYKTLLLFSQVQHYPLLYQVFLFALQDHSPPWSVHPASRRLCGPLISDLVWSKASTSRWLEKSRRKKPGFISARLQMASPPQKAIVLVR